MAATDIAAQVTAWAVAETDAQCFGEDYGVAVTWLPAQIPGPQGPQAIPVWQILLTARSPLLGQPPLFHMVPLAPVRPAEDQVKAAVTDGIRQLRDLVSRQLAGANGKPSVAAG